MAKKHVTYTVQNPLLKGPGVRWFQQLIKDKFKKLGINCPIVVDGIWGPASRAYALELMKAMGMSRAAAHKHGFTVEIRTKIDKSQRTANEKKSFNSKSNIAYRNSLKKRWAPKKVHKLVSKILTDTWDYHPPVHDGIDLICPPSASIYAPVRCKVVRADNGGWWGKGAPSAAVAAKGDGIVILQVLESVGPIKKGMRLCYGHAESSAVKVGQVVNAGHRLGRAGLANAWHVHFMVNNGKVGTRGVGNINPRAIVNYTKKHG